MKNRSSTCKEAGDALTLGTSDEIQQRRAELHLKNCADCRQDEEVMEGMRSSVLSTNDQLDDLTRARVQSKLARAMEEAAADGARQPLWRERGFKLAAAAAVALVLITGAALWWAGSHPADEPVPGADRVADAARLEVLQPRSIVQGSAPWPNSGLVLGQRVARLSVPAGVALRAGLATSAELVLYGPLDLAVETATKDSVELRLLRGILVGEYDGSKGGSLRIRSPRAVTEVVGTLFSVEAHDGQSRVSVSRGKVEVRSPGKKVTVGPRRTWSTRTSRVGPTPPSVAALLAKHERQPAASAPVVAKSEERQEPSPRMGDSAPVVRRPRAAPAPAKIVAARPATPPVPEGKSPPAADKRPDEKPKVVPGPGAAALYRSAEEALRRHDVGKAQKILLEMLKKHPGDSLADAARYELALLLLKSGKRKQALAVLGRIAGSRFRGPAHYLRCRIKQESNKKRGAMACYSAFSAAFPASPHHEQALQALIRLAAAARDCARTRGFVANYLALYPGGAFAAEAKRLRKGCRK